MSGVDLSPVDVATLLPVGTRIRSTEHPGLTGVIHRYEWARPGVISSIPYLVRWDDSSLAHRMLGWLFVYATVGAVERLEQGL